MKERVLCTLTDGADAMRAMVVELRDNRKRMPKAIHIKCGAHKIHNVASKIKDEFTECSAYPMGCLVEMYRILRR